MALRLPITHRGDVWGMAISLCELLCGRFVWRSEADTAEVVLAQSLGLCNLRDGLPSTLLRRSPLDVRQLYTPAPRHFPLRRNEYARLEVLSPCNWGLEQVLGEGWQETDRFELGELLFHALVIDPELRPSAADVLKCRFALRPDAGSEVQEEEEACALGAYEAQPAEADALSDEVASAGEDAEHPAMPPGTSE